jgi:uncharacterized protein (DUF697 family)
MNDIIPKPENDPINDLANRYRRAGGLGLQVMNLVGGQAENLLERLPEAVKAQLEAATLKALQSSLSLAQKSRGGLPDGANWLNTAVTTAMGAAGGFGGLPTALVELPVTTTILLRAIQGVAARHGFDVTREDIQKECLQVFAAAGPLDHDDGSDMAFLASRVTITGGTVQALIAKVAPRLSVVLGQKLAAQAVPILGAVVGAGINYSYTNYYQEMAEIHFGLKKLEVETGEPMAALVIRLKAELLAIS